MILLRRTSRNPLGVTLSATSHTLLCRRSESVYDYRSAKGRRITSFYRFVDEHVRTEEA